MKRIYTLIIIQSLFFNLLSSYAQVNEWVWMKGSKTANSAGSPGTKGVTLTSNEPPSVYEPCEWRDTSGNFWLFGGIDTAGPIHDDLWRYDPTTNDWTWMKGSGNTNDPGNYGTKGVPSPTTYPPSISYGVPTWVDLNNNLWMYGGGTTNTNDLWRYDISTNEWTWMKGQDSSLARGVFGVQGVPDTANNPGMRQETAATWVDAAGDLWFFGGEGASGSMNDLWRYNIATNTWTWMKGTNLPFQFSKFGTEGVEKANNVPGGRCAYSHWKDQSGNFWLFGGYDGEGSEFNDMWRYNPATNNWTWMSGTDILTPQGVYGSECNFANANVPYSRMENRACWTDASGNFWEYGGGIDSSGRFSVTRNDLWKYCVSANEWTWVSGDSTGNPMGSWGIQGVASPTNIPNGRAGAVGWTDLKGHLYLFGGSSEPFGDMYNDLWLYTIDSACGNCAAVVAPIASFQSSATSVCQYDCINYTDLSTNATSWSWTFAGGNPPTSTAENPQNVCYLTTGPYDVKLIAGNNFGTDTVSITNYINVFAAPPVPTITPVNDTLFCSTDPSYTSYQWYDSSSIIPGATDTFLVITNNGNYNVQVTNENGCSTAVGISILGVAPLPASPLQFTISPNPAFDEITLNGGWKQGTNVVTIYNALGEKLLEEQMQFSDHSPINIKTLSAGIYFIRVESEKASWTGKFVKSSAASF